MKIKAIKSVKPQPSTMAGAKNVKMRMMIGEEEGAPNFFMRHFEVEPGGHTPYHEHDFEHEIFVKKGSGIAVSVGKELPVKEGDAIFVPPNEKHQFRNTGRGRMEFLCLIPKPLEGK